MSGATLGIAAAILGLVIGAALVPGAPIFALPIVAVLLLFIGLGQLRRRSADTRAGQDFREKAEPEIEFTERDRQTLVD